MLPARQHRPPADVRRADSRWLVIGALVFVVTVGGLFAAREIYRATGPHPHVETVIRRSKFYANSLLRHRLRRANK